MAAIILLLSLSFLSLAGSFKVGAFAFKGKIYFIEKSINNYSIVQNGKEIFTLKDLKAYYSNGEDRVCFLFKDKEIIWAGNKKFDFNLNINPVLNFNKVRFFRLSLKNERFFLIGDVNPYVFDVDNGKLYRLPGLAHLKNRSLYIVFPEHIVFYKNYFVFYANPYLIAYSIEKKKPVLIKNLGFDFVTNAGLDEGFPFFKFNYNVPLKVDVENGNVLIGRKEKKDSITGRCRIGKKENLIVKLKLSNRGFSEKIDIEFRIFDGEDLIFSNSVKGLRVNLNDLTNFRPLIFHQLEKALTVNFFDKTIVLYENSKGSIDLKVVDKDRYFSIVNGNLFEF